MENIMAIIKAGLVKRNSEKYGDSEEFNVLENTKKISIVLFET